MGTVADKLLRIAETKNDIKNAIEEKGGDLEGKPFKDYADEILAIKTAEPASKWHWIKPEEWSNGKYTGNNKFLIYDHNKLGHPSADPAGNVFKNAEGVILGKNEITDMGNMFNNSQALTLDLSIFDTSNATNMNSMFFNSQMVELDLSSFDTSKVTTMSHMFNSSKVLELDLSNFDTSTVTHMNSMFEKSQALVIDLSSFDTSKVTTMNNMFRNSQALVIDLSSFDTSDVTYMRYMFQDSMVETLYVRTQDDAYNFRHSIGFPEGVNVIVGRP